VSDHDSLISPEHDLPSFEPWLRMLFASFVPLVLAMFLPKALLLPLGGTSIAMVVAAVVMVVRQERRKRARRDDAATRDREVTSRAA
jgi:hypothetical protein